MKARKSAKIIMRREEAMMRASEVEPNTGWASSAWGRLESSAGEAGGRSALLTRITVAGLERPSLL